MEWFYDDGNDSPTDIDRRVTPESRTDEARSHQLTEHEEAYEWWMYQELAIRSTPHARYISGSRCEGLNGKRSREGELPAEREGVETV